MNKPYRNSVVEVTKYLVGFRHELFGKALNFAMDHELNEIDGVFNEGDTFVFELDHLDNSDDQTLQKLVDLIRTIDGTLHSICNIHNIEDSELED